VLRRLPEPPRSAVHQGGVLTVLRQRWGLAVLGLALVEGGALLGLLAYLAPALESTGSSPTAAGAVVALYGVGLLAASRVVKRLAGRTPPASFLGAGAGGLALAYAPVALRQDVWVVGPAALLIGAAWASMHSTMQAWATEVVPQARAVMVSLFAGMLFVGSGVATAALAPWAGDFRWTPLYLTGVIVAAAFGTAAVLARAAFGRVHARPEVPPV
jgi:predicted MFS family arabinose efflux permease